MNTHQKALIVKTGPEHTHGLDELNVKLGRGWRVVQMTPMGGAATGSQERDTPALCLAALVVIERAEDATAEVMEQMEEASEELVDEIVEGRSSGAEIAEELEEERNGGPPGTRPAP